MKFTATIIAGINGAGKTSLYYNELPNESYLLGTRINTDEFASSLGSWKNANIQFKAAKIALQIRQNCIENVANFNQETTLCGKSILNLFKELKNKGYVVRLYYVGVDTPEIAKQRVRERVAKGGHDIADEVIDKRYGETLQNLARVFKFCDKISLYDNSSAKNKRIFSYDKINNALENHISQDIKWLNNGVLKELEKCTIMYEFNKDLQDFVNKKSILTPSARENKVNSIIKKYENLKNMGVKFDDKQMKAINSLCKTQGLGR